MIAGTDGLTEFMVELRTRILCWMAAALVLAAGCEKTPEQNSLRKANSYLNDNRLREAIETVESGLRQQPDSRELQRLRVVIRMVILLRAEQFDAATAAWRSLPPGDPAMAQAFHHRDSLVRSGAARLIDERAIPIPCGELVRGLEDPAPTVRRHCARALSQKRGCDAVKPLFRALRDDN
jgi:HEAT repeat protein